MKEYLTNKKKLQIPNDRDKQTRVDKIDNIQLINLGRGGEKFEEIGTNKMIEAGTRVMVRRVPYREVDPIEVQYNQNQNSLTKLKAKISERRNDGDDFNITDVLDEIDKEQQEQIDNEY